jgi:hypothetical protein
MKKIALALTLTSLLVGLAFTDADAGRRSFCKQALKTHPMPDEHRDLMKRCKAAYKDHMKAGYPRPTPPT